MRDSAPTQERVRQLFNYCPDTGRLIRRVRTARRVRIGEEAGTISSGYRRVNIDRRCYYTHRLAWLWMTGEWPNEIDHINLDRMDNRWCNLRIAEHWQNGANSRVRMTNTSGFKGVTWHYGKWMAQISAGKKHFYIGRFYDVKDAHSAYVAAAKKLHGEFSRTM